MTGLGMRWVVPPPGLSPRPRATFTSSLPVMPPDLLVDDKGIPRWLNGVTFQSLGCDTARRAQVILCGDEQDAFEARELGDIWKFDPFTVYDALEASALCGSLEQIGVNLGSRWASMVSSQLAEEILLGTDREVDPGDPSLNPSLVSAASVALGGPFSPNAAFAILEQALADMLHGASGVLHLTPRGFSEVNLIDMIGAAGAPVPVTPQGHTVVADAGFTGAEPDANLPPDGPNIQADEWWYATGPMFWAMTEPSPIGLPPERINRSRNLITEIWQAQAIVIFDPCSVVAVPVSYDLGSGGGVDGGGS